MKLPVYDYAAINDSWFLILKMNGYLATCFYKFHVLEKQKLIKTKQPDSTGKSPIRRPSPDSGTSGRLFVTRYGDTSLDKETSVFVFGLGKFCMRGVQNTRALSKNITFFYIITVHSKIFTVRISS